MTISNRKSAWQLDAELKERNEFSTATIVRNYGDRLDILYNQRDAQDIVVSPALGFILECARRYNMTGAWFAVWSNNCSKSRHDTNRAGSVTTYLAKQAVMFVSRNAQLNFVKKDLEDIIAIIADLPSDVATQELIRQIEWLHENAVGGWGCFSGGAREEGGCPQPKSHFLFKTAIDGVAFKLRFG